MAASVDECLQNEAYLVARGVRPLALADSQVSMKQLREHAEPGAIPFTARGRMTGYPLQGYAAQLWVIELLKWAEHNAPEDHRHQILGLLLGYSPEAIQRFHDQPSQEATGRICLHQLNGDELIPVVDEISARLARLTQLPIPPPELEQSLDRLKDVDVFTLEPVSVATVGVAAGERTVLLKPSEAVLEFLGTLRALDDKFFGEHGSDGTAPGDTPKLDACSGRPT